MPAAQLTYKPWNAAALAYGAAQTKSFAAWGINDQFSGALKSQTPDELNLSLVGDALAPIPFVYRSILKVALDGKPFFTGYVTEDLDREGMPNKNNGQVKVEGPWWFLENLVYQLNIPILTGVVNNAPIWVNSYWTHFTLNMPMVPAFTSTAEFLFPVVSYGVQYWNSQQQLKDILEYAIANGAYLQYKLADIINIPVLPADVMNITCAEAIRRQIEAVDAVVWFDHTQDPPAFHCQQRSALGARTVTVGAAPVAGAAGAATGFKLKEMFDRRVPYVLINFQEPVSVAGVSGVINVQQMYPNPLPADNLKGLITTVPIRAINGTTQKKFIQTDTVDPDDLAWWLLRFPEMDPDENPNAANDFAGLKFTPGTARSRQTNLPNMIIGGGWAPWMGGQVQRDVVMGQFNYSKKQNGNQPSSDVANHTKRKTFQATDLNFPDGANLTVTTWTSNGEPDAFAGLAQTVFNNLNARQWEGMIPVFEDVYTGDQVMGQNLNVADGVADWATMAALVQSITFNVRTGGIHYELQVGPNKSLSAQNIAQMMRASTRNYISVFFFGPSPSTPVIQYPQQEGFEDGGEGAPQYTQHHVAAGDGSSGVVIAGDPSITLQTYDVGGNPQTPQSANPAGVVDIDLDATQGSDGNWHSVTLQEVIAIKPDKTLWTAIALVSDFYKPVAGGLGGAAVSNHTFCCDMGDYIIADLNGAPVVTTIAPPFAVNANVAQFTVANSAGIVVGQTVSGNGITSFAIVTGVAGNVISVTPFVASLGSSGNYTFAGVLIAKPPKIRPSIGSETYLDGSGVHTFTYAAVAGAGGNTMYFQRTNTSGSGAQVEEVTPAYLPPNGGFPGDTICALTMATQMMPMYPGNQSVFVPVSLLDIHDRDWALQYVVVTS